MFVLVPVLVLRLVAFLPVLVLDVLAVLLRLPLMGALYVLPPPGCVAVVLAHGSESKLG
jgi:hypothetical protein